MGYAEDFSESTASGKWPNSHRVFSWPFVGNCAGKKHLITNENMLNSTQGAVLDHVPQQTYFAFSGGPSFGKHMHYSPSLSQ